MTQHRPRPRNWLHISFHQHRTSFGLIRECGPFGLTQKHRLLGASHSALSRALAYDASPWRFNNSVDSDLGPKARNISAQGIALGRRKPPGNNVLPSPHRSARDQRSGAERWGESGRQLPFSLTIPGPLALAGMGRTVGAIKPLGMDRAFGPKAKTAELLNIYGLASYFNGPELPACITSYEIRIAQDAQNRHGSCLIRLGFCLVNACPEPERGPACFFDDTPTESA